MNEIPLALFLVSFAFRAALNNLEAFSLADETSYLNFTQKFAERGVWKTLPALTQDFIDARPGCTHPFRFSWYAVMAQICRRTGTGVVSYRKLAWVSTVAGSCAPSIAYLLAKKHGFPALPAALLVMTSPISLGMGRRALQDATLGSLTVLGFLAASTGDARFVFPALLAIFFVKEVSLVGWPGYATVYLLSGGTVAWGLLALGLPPLLFLGVSWKLMGLDAAKAVAIWRRLTRHENDAYAMGYGRGPVHTYVLEFALLSPLVAVAAVRGWAWSTLSLGFLVHAALWSVHKFKNYRFFTGADIVLRVLAAAAFVAWNPWFAYGAVAVCMAADLWMFRRVFVERQVYDPVVHTVARALDMVP